MSQLETKKTKAMFFLEKNIESREKIVSPVSSALILFSRAQADF